MWEFTGQSRPDFAQQPGPGQESVWDYPRPPRLERSDEHVVVRVDGVVVADTRRPQSRAHLGLYGHGTSHKPDVVA